MNWKKLLAELIGTFTLTLAVGLSINGSIGLATPVVAALTLGLFVYTVGAVSGAHLNPAVTLALASINKISGSEAFDYILIQILGALLALSTIGHITGSTDLGVVADNMPGTGMAEAFGAFFLVFGVCSVVFKKVKDVASGLVIGGSLLLGILLSGSLSNGVLNPAVAIGIGSISAMYLIAPLFGGIIAAQVYEYLSSK